MASMDLRVLYIILLSKFVTGSNDEEIQCNRKTNILGDYGFSFIPAACSSANGKRFIKDSGECCLGPLCSNFEVNCFSCGSNTFFNYVSSSVVCDPTCVCGGDINTCIGFCGCEWCCDECPAGSKYVDIIQVCEVCGQNEWSYGGSNACNKCTKSACKGLTTLANPNLKGNQVVVNEGFKKDVQHLIECAKKQKMKLLVASTSRCGVPTNNVQAVDNSDHQLGMAIDVQPILGGEKIAVSKEDMAKAYCAYHMSIEPCKSKYQNNTPKQTAKNNAINKFITCAGSKGLSVGATYKGKNKGKWLQDANHFQRGKYSKAAKQAYQKLLKKFCKSECSDTQRINPSSEACKCAGYSS